MFSSCCSFSIISSMFPTFRLAWRGVPGSNDGTCTEQDTPHTPMDTVQKVKQQLIHLTHWKTVHLNRPSLGGVGRGQHLLKGLRVERTQESRGGHAERTGGRCHGHSRGKQLVFDGWSPRFLDGVQSSARATIHLQWRDTIIIIFHSYSIAINFCLIRNEY